MNCQQATKYIWDYCDKKLSPTISLLVEKHCEECEECQHHLKLTCLENEVLSDSSTLPALSPDFTARVMSSLPVVDKKYNHSRTPEWFKHSQFRTASTAILGTIILLIVVPLLVNKSLVPWSSMQPVPRIESQMGAVTDSEIPISEPVQNLAPANTSEESHPLVDNSKTGEEDPAVITDDKQDSSAPRPSVAPAESSRSKPFFPYSIHFPAAYQIVGNPIFSGNSLVYKYSQTGSDYIVLVTVTKLDSSPDQTVANDSMSAQASDTNDSNSEPTLFGTELKSREMAPAPAAPVNSVLSWTVQADNQVYRITLDGNLSPQELALLAGSIEFRSK